MKQLFFISLFILIGWETECQALIADETTIEETKTTVKIETCNDSIAVRFIHSKESDLSRYTVAYKKDRHGRYKVYTFYFPIGKKEELIRFVSSIKIQYK